MQDRIFLEVLLNKFSQQFWFGCAYHILGEELMESDFFFKVLKIALFVQRNLWHIFEKSSDFNAAELDGGVQVQGLEVLFEVIVSNLDMKRMMDRGNCVKHLLD